MNSELIIWSLRPTKYELVLYFELLFMIEFYLADRSGVYAIIFSCFSSSYFSASIYYALSGVLGGERTGDF